MKETARELGRLALAVLVAAWSFAWWLPAWMAGAAVSATIVGWAEGRASRSDDGFD